MINLSLFLAVKSKSRIGVVGVLFLFERRASLYECNAIVAKGGLSFPPFSILILGGILLIPLAMLCPFS